MSRVFIRLYNKEAHTHTRTHGECTEVISLIFFFYFYRVSICDFFLQSLQHAIMETYICIIISITLLCDFGVCVYAWNSITFTNTEFHYVHQTKIFTDKSCNF